MDAHRPRCDVHGLELVPWSPDPYCPACEAEEPQPGDDPPEPASRHAFLPTPGGACEACGLSRSEGDHFRVG